MVAKLRKKMDNYCFKKIEYRCNKGICIIFAYQKTIHSDGKEQKDKLLLSL